MTNFRVTILFHEIAIRRYIPRVPVTVDDKTSLAKLKAAS